MKLISSAAVLTAALLAACAPAPVTVVEEVTVVDVPAATLTEATGMPGTAIVTAARTGDEYIVIYREADVTPEQVAAAPAKICAYTGTTLFGADSGELPDYEITAGLAQMSVSCG